MTTTQFTPNSLTPFQFTATLDDADYDVIIPWNVYRRNWYVVILGPNNQRLMTRALVASPPDYDISLTAGIFRSKMVFREALQVFEVTP